MTTKQNVNAENFFSSKKYVRGQRPSTAPRIQIYIYCLCILADFTAAAALVGCRFVVARHSASAGSLSSGVSTQNFAGLFIKNLVRKMRTNIGKCSFLLMAVLFIAVGAEWNTNDYMKREHSLIRPYQGSGMTIPYWDFMGSTMVTNNYIRLTPDAQSQQGAIWNTVPCNVRNWEMQVHFKVYGKGRDLFGDGLAIWYSKERMQPGPVFGSKDFFNGLAVILDTYSNHNGPHNHQHPYISAMINNGSLHYDHDRDGTHTQLAGCEAKFRNLEHDTHVTVRYERDTLTVSTDIANKGAWKECFSVKEIKLPTGYYFGITATTGDLSDNHEILSVRLFELDLPNDPKDEEDRSKIIPSATFFESPRDHIDDPKPSSLSGIKIFLLMLVGALALIACVVIGIMFYQKHQENSRKRFY